MNPWLFDLPINSTVRADLPGIGDIIEGADTAIDVLKRTLPDAAKAFQDFEKNLVELGSQSAFLPQGKAIRIFGLFLNGLKLLKIVLGSDEEGGGTAKDLGIFDLNNLLQAAPDFPVNQLFVELAEQARIRLSGAGYVIIDPTFLADPAVGGK